MTPPGKGRERACGLERPCRLDREEVKAPAKTLDLTAPAWVRESCAYLDGLTPGIAQQRLRYLALDSGKDQRDKAIVHAP